MQWEHPAEIASDNELTSLLRSRGKLLDVRSEIEFNRSSLASSVNLPLLKTAERAAVGKTYKNQGQEAAISLGHELVSGTTKEERIQLWLDSIKQQNIVAMYCARGGLRSEISQTWIREAGIDLPRIFGGYKRIRGILIQALDKLPQSKELVVLSGYTGSGKTELLQKIKDTRSVVDLEGAAKHRGSAFGSFTERQTAQASFENQVAIDLLNARDCVLLEDESRHIGDSIIPQKLFKLLKNARRIEVSSPLAVRSANIAREYVIEPLRDSSPFALEKLLQEKLFRISKRLGGARTKECSTLIANAFETNPEKTEAHLSWISYLLENYYDPFYIRGIEKYPERDIISAPEGITQRVITEVIELTS